MSVHTQEQATTSPACSHDEGVNSEWGRINYYPPPPTRRRPLRNLILQTLTLVTSDQRLQVQFLVAQEGSWHRQPEMASAMRLSSQLTCIVMVVNPTASKSGPAALAWCKQWSTRDMTMSIFHRFFEIFINYFPKCKEVTWTWPRPYSGTACHP